MLKKLKKFFNETSGSILPITALMMIPMVMVATATIDYTRYTSVKNEIQSGVDAAGIAATKELQNILPLAAGLQGDAFNDFVEAELKDYAGNFLQANITSPAASDAYTFDVNYIPATRNSQGGVRLTAVSTYDTLFGGFGGNDGGLLFKDEFVDNITALINVSNRSLEIALVMDNSGSMAFRAGDTGRQTRPAPVSSRRITLLQNAAGNLITDLETAVANAAIDMPLQFSVVPFSSSVNVGDINHENHDDNFLDVNGFASYHNENLDWRTYVPAPGERVTISGGRAFLREANGTQRSLSRLDIFPMLNTQWEGCVEMRPYPHNVQDTYRSNRAGFNASASDALFVPYMVPDEPDSEFLNFYSDSNRRLEIITDTRNGSRFGSSDGYTSNYIPDFYTLDHSNGLPSPVFFGDNIFSNNVGINAVRNNVHQNQINRTNWVSKYQAFTGYDRNRINSIPRRGTRNIQLRDILSDLATPSFGRDSSDFFADSGPNAFCPDLPVLQLTEDFDEVRDTINNMEAHGGTNIQQGLTWGWKTLSEAEPFTTGRTNTDVENRKLLILLTDGNNQLLEQSSQNNSQYSAWGYQRTDNVLRHALTGANTHRRLFGGTSAQDVNNTIYDGQFTLPRPANDSDDYADLMNLHTNQACNNIKDDAISIYAIAFDVPTGGKVRELLENCSGSGRIFNNGVPSDIVSGVEFYHDVQGLELNDTFAEISAGITAIRIAE